MATGVLAQVQDYLKPAAQSTLPDYAQDASKADLGSMAGQMQGPTSYTPTDNSLVSGQLDKLLNKDSPYLTLARTNAAQTANSRGLLNSSMAAGAGEAAAIQSALPIAQQDAQTFGTSEKSNADAANQFASAANTYGRDAALTKYQGVLAQGAAQKAEDFQRQTALANAALQAATQESRQRELDQADLQRQQQQQQFEATQALDKQKLQQNQGQFEQQAQADLATKVANIRQTAINARAQIEQNPGMSAEAKASAIQALGEQSSQDIAEMIRVSGINLPDAWPDWINQMTPATPAATPAPAPQPPLRTSPWYDDFNRSDGA